MNGLCSETQDAHQVIECVSERWPNRFFWSTGVGVNYYSLLYLCCQVGFAPEYANEDVNGHTDGDSCASSMPALPSFAQVRSFDEWDVTDESGSLASYWRRVLEYYDGSGLNPTVCSSRPMVVRLLAKQRIPFHARGRVWLTMSGARGVQRRAEIRGAAHKYGPLLWQRCSREACYAISLDVGRTFSGDDEKAIAFQKVSSRDGLTRVLRAFGARNTQVGYCQGLSFVASTLLLVMDEASAFYMLSWLVEDYLPSDYYTSLKSALCDTRVLDKLLMRGKEHLMRHLFEKCGLPEVSMFSIQWFMCLFSRSLPLENVLQIWDRVFLCSLSEGPAFSRHEILFRVSIGIFSHLEKELLDANSPRTVQSLINSVELTEDEIGQFLVETIGPLEPLRDDEWQALPGRCSADSEVLIVKANEEMCIESEFYPSDVHAEEQSMAPAGKRRLFRVPAPGPNRPACCPFLPRLLASDVSSCCVPPWHKLASLFSRA